MTLKIIVIILNPKGSRLDQIFQKIKKINNLKLEWKDTYQTGVT